MRRSEPFPVALPDEENSDICTGWKQLLFNQTLEHERTNTLSIHANEYFG